MFSPSPSLSPQAPAVVPEPSRPKYVILGVISLIVLVLVGVIVWLRLRDGGEGVPSKAGQEVQIEKSLKHEVSPQEVQAVIEVPDQDRDNLPDTEEARVGTDPTKSDTDGDGISDFEEVVLRKSDPLKPTEALSHPSLQPVPVQP